MTNLGIGTLDGTICGSLLDTIPAPVMRRIGVALTFQGQVAAPNRFERFMPRRKPA